MTDKKATLFEFTSYVVEPEKNQVVFNYKTAFDNNESITFTETIILPKSQNPDISKEAINALLKSLHIIIGISYYKFYCATNVALPYTFSKNEADFWNTVYKKGLGEFFYQNKLNPNISPVFPFDKNAKTISFSLPKNNTCLIGIGGGKDSIVAAELLKEHSFTVDAFLVKTGAHTQLIETIIETLDINGLTIERILDPKVHQPHQYNGHIPISAIYAFLGLLTATLNGYSYVIVGNEHSSNFGNTTYKGLVINHQWSKSFEFEQLLQNYVKEMISPDIYYFSLLRSFYEIRIVKLFTNYKKYFPYFSSCNNNFKIQSTQKTLWCGACPKCVFVFTLLSAFVSKKELLGIFGKNLYQDQTLLPLFKDVLGFGNIKPFDCVGTFTEAQSALYLAKKKFANDFIMRQLGAKAKYHKEVFATNPDTAIPAQFAFLGMETALIAGYGKEGKITKQYLKKEYPGLKIAIADAVKGKDYLKNQADFDIAIKTPGIKKELIIIPYTTATNIFFSKVSGYNTIIGVTGSKGKSTTATLIFTLLKNAGKEVMLLGNIGQPMLGALLQPINKETIFVLELSSYQLDDIQFSPDIAVVTNLFPEHLDYHGNLKNYYQAKKNIIHFQGKNNYFIYNPLLRPASAKAMVDRQGFEGQAKNTAVKSWLKNYQGIATPFANDILVPENEIQLLGQHNQDNIKAAISVAKIFNIKEEIIKDTIKNFKGLPHRLEKVGEFNGITFYDDAISTTPESTIMAIKAIKNIDTIFLGGTDRGYDFAPLEKALKKYNIHNVVLFPESGKRIITHPKDFTILKTKSMGKAVAFAYKNTNKGSVCLLSCASPSYSLWKNFEEKGDEFARLVKKLAKH